MPLVARSDLSTGNSTCSSYVCQSRHLVFAFTAPTSIGDGNGENENENDSNKSSSKKCPYPNYSREEARAFVAKHGLAVRAIGIVVGDAREAFARAVEGGAAPATEPRDTVDAAGKTQTSAEVALYGDVRLRLISGDSEAPF
jgi:4-hydroxyphenylpyruvate dioxygenase